MALMTSHYFHYYACIGTQQWHPSRQTKSSRRACENPTSPRSYLDGVALNASGGLKGLDSIQKKELLNAGCHHFLTLPHRSPSNADTLALILSIALSNDKTGGDIDIFYQKGFHRFPGKLGDKQNIIIMNRSVCK